MSQFRTEIPVELAETLALLPSGACVEAIEPGTDRVTLVWSHHLTICRYNTSDYPLPLLRVGMLPEGVVTVEAPPPPGQAPVAASIPLTKPGKRRKG